MKASLRALLAGIIDYAGIYPPAALPLEESIRNYVRYCREPESWMLGRFVCSAEKLNELGRLVYEMDSSTGTLPLCIIGNSAARNLREHVERIAGELGMISHFRSSFPIEVRLDTYEMRLAYSPHREQLPPTLDIPLGLKKPWPKAGTDADPWLALSAPIFSDPYLTGVMLCFEAAPGIEPGPLIDGIARLRLSPLAPRKWQGVFKLRCGGQTVPAAEQVASAIIACRDAGVPIKFTAGLHHPIRHHDPQSAMWMHGFINLFVAGVLAHARRLTAVDLLPIIEETDPIAFTFDGAGVRWRNHSATTEEIVEARKQVLSFGSCSFDEPRDDLRQLGWLTPE